MKFENNESPKPKFISSQNKVKLVSTSVLHMGSYNEAGD